MSVSKISNYQSPISCEVTDLKTNPSNQPTVISNPPQNWPNVIWQEWRNCEDEAYAHHLFELVVNEPTDGRATAVLMLMGALFGAIGGGLLTLLRYPEILTVELIVLGIIAGVTGGLLVLLELRLARRSLWGFWLLGLMGVTGGWLLIFLLPGDHLITALLAWAIVLGITIGASGGLLVMLALGLGRRSLWGAWLPGLIPATLVLDKSGRLTFGRATIVLILRGALFGAVGGGLLTSLLYPGHLTVLIVWGIGFGIAVGAAGGLLVMVGLRLGRRVTWACWLFGLFGTIGGGLLTLLRYPIHLNTELITWEIGASITVGTGGGLLIMLALGLGRRSSWGAWLLGLIPANLIVARSGRLTLNSLYFGLVVVLSSGMGLWLTGAVFFGQPNYQSDTLDVVRQPNYQFYTLLVGLVGLAIVGFFQSRWAALVSTLMGLLVGLSFGLFFGLGLAQLVGMLITPLDELNSARLVGLAVGTGAGLFFGRRAGLIGVLLGQGVATVLALAGGVMAVGSDLVLLHWLVGLLLGGVVASVGKMYLSKGRPDFADAYAYRAAYLWWLGRPPVAEVEAALRQHASGEIWQKLFDNLEKQQTQPQTAEAVWGYLQRPNWVDQFVGRQALVALSHEAIPPLLAAAGDRDQPLRRTAMWLVQSIGHETITRLAGQADRLLCADCLTCTSPHPVGGSDLSVLYYGCRICGQSREFFYCPRGVVAVLDSEWTEARPHQGGLLHRRFGSSSVARAKTETQTPDNGLLRVNWLARRKLFDFDRVEIIQATDEEIERFAVQVGNDTDPVRQPRYAQMQCLIAPQCRLSENTQRVLSRVFGQVERGQEVRE